MTQITEVVPIIGANNSTFDPDTTAVLNSLVSKYMGNIDGDNFLSSEAEALGINKTGHVHRASASVATLQTTTSSSFGDLATVGPSVSLQVPAGNTFVIIGMSVDYRISAGSGGAAYRYVVNNNAPTLADYTWNSPSIGVIDYIDRTTSGTVTTSNRTFLSMESLFQSTEQTYTYKLQYRRDSTATAEFQNRKICALSFTIPVSDQ